MQATREQIGERVRRLRGIKPQSHVATVMAARYGHSSWRQTVVAKVESGERALQFSEGVDLAKVLGVTLQALAGEPEDPGTEAATRELMRVRRQIDVRLEELHGRTLAEPGEED